MSSLNSGKVWFSSHLPYRLHPVNVPITWDPPSVFIARAKVVIFSTPVYTNIVWYFYIRRCGKRLKSVHTCTSTEYRIYLVQFPPTLILSLIGLLPVHCTRASSSCCLNSNGAGLGSATLISVRTKIKPVSFRFLATVRVGRTRDGNFKPNPPKPIAHPNPWG